MKFRGRKLNLDGKRKRKKDISISLGFCGIGRFSLSRNKKLIENYSVDKVKKL